MSACWRLDVSRSFPGCDPIHSIERVAAHRLTRANDAAPHEAAGTLPDERVDRPKYLEPGSSILVG